MGKLLDKALTLFETVVGPIGWRSEWNGSYTAFSGRFLVYDRSGAIRMHIRGYVTERWGSPVDVYLYDPPGFLNKHRHGACLQLLRPNEKWFKLHFAKPAYDFAAAYDYVERFLAEAYVMTH